MSRNTNKAPPQVRVQPAADSLFPSMLSNSSLPYSVKETLFNSSALLYISAALHFALSSFAGWAHNSSFTASSCGDHLPLNNTIKQAD